MIYKDFKDKKLSALGLGAMRLPIMNDDSMGGLMKSRLQRW